MRELAKLGFTQSYTYFTWKNSRHEMIEYFNELAWGEEKEYFRPNFFPVTPDILHAYLQHGGPPAFVTRLVLAATLSPSYGIYSGYEHFENVPVARGLRGVPELREVRDPRARPRRPAAADDAAAERDPPRERRAPAPVATSSGSTPQNDQLFAYAKQEPGNTIIVVANLDPHNAAGGPA